MNRSLLFPRLALVSRPLALPLNAFSRADGSTWLLGNLFARPMHSGLVVKARTASALATAGATAALVASVSHARPAHCAGDSGDVVVVDMNATAGQLANGSRGTAAGIDLGEDDFDDNGDSKSHESAAVTAADDAFLDTVLAMIGPVAGKFGLGGMLGYSAGYALKQASKVAMLLVGASVVALQVLQYCGYIEVKWTKIQRDLVGRIDSDNSGGIGFKDIKHYMKKLFAILRHQGPVAGGFSTGIYLGLYQG